LELQKRAVNDVVAVSAPPQMVELKLKFWSCLTIVIRDSVMMKTVTISSWSCFGFGKRSNDGRHAEAG
jgi:hypothetical protein